MEIKKKTTKNWFGPRFGLLFASALGRTSIYSAPRIIGVQVWIESIHRADSIMRGKDGIIIIIIHYNRSPQKIDERVCFVF